MEPLQRDTKTASAGRTYSLVSLDACDICFWVLSYMSLSFRYAGFQGGFANGPNSNRLLKFDKYSPVYHLNCNYI